MRDVTEVDTYTTGFRSKAIPGVLTGSERHPAPSYSW